MATALKRSTNSNANQTQTRGLIYNRRTVIKMQGNYKNILQNISTFQVIYRNRQHLFDLKLIFYKNNPGPYH